MNTDSKSILVTGANGQLGKEIQKLSIIYPQYDFLFETKEILAIENKEAVKKYFGQKQIDFCINCAAYTLVDKAESDKEIAFKINGDGTGNLATICKDHQTSLIHISTDYVFNGNSKVPYKEDSKIDPQNVYGASKLRGEEIALNILPTTVIIRTSWLFSSFGNNFVKTMKRLMSEKENLNVVNDQIGSPTYAADLAECIMKIIENEKRLTGIFNYCNKGKTSWFDFAEFIKKCIKSNCNINPIPTSQFPTAAKRPNFSVLDTLKIEHALGIKIPSWQNATERCLSILSSDL